MANLLEVHSYGIIEGYPLRNREVDLDLFLLRRLIICGLFRRCGLYIIDDLNALVAEPLIHIVHFVGGHILFLQCVNEFTVGQRTAILLAFGKQAFNDLGARRFFLLRPLCHSTLLLIVYSQGSCLPYKSIFPCSLRRRTG